jgi:hypothetical protein
MLRIASVSLVGLVLLSSPAFALCTSYPNTLTNGTTADGGQVMANFNCAALTSGSTINGLTLTGTTAFPGSSQVSSTGLLGIGMAPINILDITQNQNNFSVVSLMNNSAGNGAASRLYLQNGTYIGAFSMYGTGFTTAGMSRANGVLPQCPAPTQFISASMAVKSPALAPTEVF